MTSVTTPATAPLPVPNVLVIGTFDTKADELGALAERATEQLRRLEALHLKAAALAL